MAKKKIYIVVHAISESGNDYKPGAKYDGDFVERFLKGGQIKVK